MKKTPLIIILGPTASGKTALSLDIAQHLNTEIISADSMQVYKHMNIGTAKPTLEERRGIVHHLIDEVMPSDEFNVVRYVELAHSRIADIHAKGKVPVVVGGTGLYIDSLVDNVSFGETAVDYELRDKFAKMASVKGNEHIHQLLEQVDPQSANRIHCNNLKRVIRALEVYYTSGKTMTEHQSVSKINTSPYDAITFMPVWDREALYERIDMRVDIMMHDGLIDEVESLIKMGYNRGLISMQGIGYKEVLDYYYGLAILPDTVDIIKRNTRRYAKRQITWFKRNADIIELDAMSPNISKECIDIVNRWVCERNDTCECVKA